MTNDHNHLMIWSNKSQKTKRFWLFLLTRHASKGIISLMLPDELRPICQESGEPVDFIYNPFGVFSRMNLSQLLEITCAKPTWITDRLIKKDPKNAENYLKDLNETVIKHLGDSEYYDRINSMVEIMRNDNSVKEKFLESVYRNNLYVEVPSFAKINLRELLKTAKPAVNENVIIPKKLIDYMKQKTNCLKDLVINEDIILPKVFVGPIYVQKLYKIASKLITYRDFGPLKFVGTLMSHRQSLNTLNYEDLFFN